MFHFPAVGEPGVAVLVSDTSVIIDLERGTLLDDLSPLL